MRCSIAVLGGGVAGLAAAHRLLRGGHAVRVYERTLPAQARGTAFLLPENGRAAARALGLWEALAPVGAPLDRFVAADRLGAAHRTEPLDAHGFVHSAFVDRLAAGLPPEVLCRGRAVVGLDRTADGRVRAARLEDGTPVEAEIFLGADGVHSVVRAALFPSARLEPSGVHELVSVVHAPQVVRDVAGQFLKFVDPASSVAAGLVPCGGDVVAWFIQMAADRYPLASREHAERRDFAASVLQGWPEPLGGLVARTDFAASYLWRAVDMPPLPSVVCGNVALIGDAAHPLLPFTSQGVAAALGDAAALADALDAYPDALDAGLAAYAVVRRDEVRAFFEGGRALRDSFLERRADLRRLPTPLVRPAVRA